MVASSMGELEKMLRQQMEKAMTVVDAKILADMYEEVGSFYGGGQPVLYQRTGNLGSSPRTTALTKGGNVMSFEAYLDQSVGYNVPNEAFINKGYASHFSTEEVFNAAEAGTAHIVGKPGFWARSEKKMQKELDSTMRGFFK